VSAWPWTFRAAEGIDGGGLDERFAPAETGDALPLTQQPTVNGRFGTPLQMVACEVVSIESDNSVLFNGLGRFLHAQKLQVETAVDLALIKLIGELREKAKHLGADAVVSVSISSIRGVGAGGQRHLRISAVGTAIRFQENGDIL